MNVFVVPAYDEEANIGRLLADLAARPALWAGGRVLVVDDGSADATAAAAERHRGPLPLEVLRFTRNQGPGRAFDAGFRRALALDADHVVTLEADTTSDLDAVATMLAAARRGADVVLASVHGGGALRNVERRRVLLSRAASATMRRSSGVSARTVSSFFRVYRASALRAGYARHGDDFIRESGFACKAEILWKLAGLGLRVEEVPVVLDAARRFGDSKMRVLPTVGGYTRLLGRQLASRLKEPV